MVEKLKALFTEEEGQGMTEYGLVLGVLAVGVVALLITFRGQIMTMFQNVIDSLTNAGVSPTTTTTP
jgi:pilus assembly protein Flp/PilA